MVAGRMRPSHLVRDHLQQAARTLLGQQQSGITCPSSEGSDNLSSTHERNNSAVITEAYAATEDADSWYSSTAMTPAIQPAADGGASSLQPHMHAATEQLLQQCQMQQGCGQTIQQPKQLTDVRVEDVVIVTEQADHLCTVYHRPDSNTHGTIPAGTGHAPIPSVTADTASPRHRSGLPTSTARAMVDWQPVLQHAADRQQQQNAASPGLSSEGRRDNSCHASLSSLAADKLTNILTYLDAVEAQAHEEASTVVSNAPNSNR